MTLHRINHSNGGMNMSYILLAVFIAMLSFGTSLQAADLPPELPLWEKLPAAYAIRHDVKKQVRSNKARAGFPSGLNRVFSSVSLNGLRWQRLTEKQQGDLGIGGTGEIWGRMAERLSGMRKGKTRLTHR